MNTILKHTKCGGSLVLELSNLYKITSPSIILGLEGVSAGVGEIKRTSSSRILAQVHCLKCGEDYSIEDVEKISCQCFSCKSVKSSTKMFISELRLISCENCTDHLQGKKVSLTETARKTMQYFSVGENIRFSRLSDILQKPLNF